MLVLLRELWPASVSKVGLAQTRWMKPKRSRMQVCAPVSLISNTRLECQHKSHVLNVEISRKRLKAPHSFKLINRLRLSVHYGPAPNNTRKFGANNSLFGYPPNPALATGLYPNNPAFGPVYFIQPDVNSNFKALLLTVSRSLSNGLQFRANYRWAHSIDESSYEGPGFVTNHLPAEPEIRTGDSDFDVRHSFSFSALYELPFGKSGSRLRRALLGGYQINATFTAHSGFPWTPVTGHSVSTPRRRREVLRYRHFRPARHRP